MTQFAFDASTEYRNAYSWKNKPQEEEKDKYEAVVEKMMQGQFDSSDSNKKVTEEDPYEIIVQRKMNEPLNDGKEKQMTQQNQTNKQKTLNKKEQELARPESRASSNGKEPDQCSVCSRSSSRSKGSAKSNNLTEDNLSISSGSGRLSGDKNKMNNKKTYDASHLNKKKGSLSEQAESTGTVRPVFLRNPDHATEEEKKHLYGPFYVSWPKNKTMPSQYAELQRVYHKHHY